MKPSLSQVNPWRLALWGSALALLTLPWVAMQFTAEVRWDLGDFVVFGAMLLVAGGAVEGIVRLTPDARVRAAAGAGIALTFLLVWADLAVGLFS